MKKYLIFIAIISTTVIHAQFSFDVVGQHVSFTDNFTDSEASHWQPGNIEFFAPDLNRSSTFSDGWLRFLNTSTLATTYLENGIFSFQEI